MNNNLELNIDYNKSGGVIQPINEGVTITATIMGKPEYACYSSRVSAVNIPQQITNIKKIIINNSSNISTITLVRDEVDITIDTVAGNSIYLVPSEGKNVMHCVINCSDKVDPITQ